jgi:hypothetical protein
MIRTSKPEREGKLRTSKNLKHQVLLDAEEMEELFAHLGDFSLYVVSQPVTDEQMEIPRSHFFALYRRYIESLKRGELLQDPLLRPFFSSIWTVDPSILYAMEVAGGKYLIKPLRPILQLQLHEFIFSNVDKKIHPLVQGPGSISWGIQFSYPQIYQDPKTDEMVKVARELPNSQLYFALSRWLRAHTLPTMFSYEGERIVSSLRLGKKCVSWIQTHPQLERLSPLSCK